MPSALLPIAFYFLQLQSTGSSPATFAWPLVVIAVALLIVFSPWGRGIVKITTKFGALERQVADTAQKTEQHEQQLTSQQQEIKKQQRILQKLAQDVARYSISDYIFYLLFNLDQAQKVKSEYLYRDDGTMWRNLRFLMDHGYVEEIYPVPADRTDLKACNKTLSISSKRLVSAFLPPTVEFRWILDAINSMQKGSHCFREED